MKTYGCGDSPEDWVCVYNIALNNMDWKSRNRLIKYIVDTRAHGTEYTSRDKYPWERTKIVNYIREC